LLAANASVARFAQEALRAEATSAEAPQPDAPHAETPRVRAAAASPRSASPVAAEPVPSSPTPERVEGLRLDPVPDRAVPAVAPVVQGLWAAFGVAVLLALGALGQWRRGRWGMPA